MTSTRNTANPHATLNPEATVAIVGGGKMGEAILAGLLKSSAVDASQVVVVDPASVRGEHLTAKYEVDTVRSITEIGLSPGDVCILAVKPQVMFDVLPAVDAVTRGALVVSIAVGISTKQIESALVSGSPVVRVMPNTPAMVGEGMSLVSGGVRSSANQVELVRALFGELGRAVIIDEHLQNAGSAISGSGPAYFALIIDALSRAGVAQGLSRSVAQELATQTMLGTARLLFETGEHPQVVIDSVTSPGGTTIQALAELERGRIHSVFHDAVEAAVYRADELGEELDDECLDSDDEQ